MSTTSDSERFSQTDEIVSVVLQAERAALADVERFKRQVMLFALVGALRVALAKKRGDARVTQLRARMAAHAQLRRLQRADELAALAGEPAENPSSLATLDRAIAKVIEELAGVCESG